MSSQDGLTRTDVNPKLALPPCKYALSYLPVAPPQCQTLRLASDTFKVPSNLPAESLHASRSKFGRTDLRYGAGALHFEERERTKSVRRQSVMPVAIKLPVDRPSNLVHGFQELLRSPLRNYVGLGPQWTRAVSDHETLAKDCNDPMPERKLRAEAKVVETGGIHQTW